MAGHTVPRSEFNDTGIDFDSIRWSNLFLWQTEQKAGTNQGSIDHSINENTLISYVVLRSVQNRIEYPWQLYLQCTMTGPPSGGCIDRNRRMNMSSGVAYSGTPWSGHARNCSWRTSLRSEHPSWRQCRNTCHSNTFEPLLSTPSLNTVNIYF